MNRDISHALENMGFYDYKIEAVGNGNNSNVYHVKTEGKDYAFKVYPNKGDDQRPRLTTEVNVLRLIRYNGIYKVPKPLSWNTKENWALFSWIDGTRPLKLSCSDWSEFFGFIKSIQNLENPDKIPVNAASESCNTYKEHLDLIETRLIDCKKYLIMKSYKKCEGIVNGLINQLNAIGLITSNCFINDIRILSPSDIGIHNMLRTSDGLNYIDFEYAGWDDPYKLLADCILQPNQIIKQKDVHQMIKIASNAMNIQFDGSNLKIFVSLYRIKWVTIISKLLQKENASEVLWSNTINDYLKQTEYYSWGSNVQF
ncbi:phosphotransferase [Prochlorococcus sp. MIT 1300]|uniref:phosphotransferase n=1 Tax=Prochlorococcus sp. MIT 1300 TaxID=3096218 RepID=UPI002A75D497|nr:phosphotransferase [Prochlorococcus sp. MIT 1300]